MASFLGNVGTEIIVGVAVYVLGPAITALILYLIGKRVWLAIPWVTSMLVAIPTAGIAFAIFYITYSPPLWMNSQRYFDLSQSQTFEFDRADGPLFFFATDVENKKCVFNIDFGGSLTTDLIAPVNVDTPFNLGAEKYVMRVMTIPNNAPPLRCIGFF